MAELTIGSQVNASANTVLALYQMEGYRHIKHPVKPILTKEMKQKRLDFCLKYRGFDWRNAIRTDETSVV